MRPLPAFATPAFATPAFAVPAFAVHALAALLLAATPAGAADTPMSGAEFEAYTTGKTLYFYSRGRAYGAEEYKEDRQVVWSFLDGECREGVWYEEDDFICFVYEHDPTPQCWLFFREPTGLRALFRGEPGQTELYEAGEAEEPMVCLGPEVGV